MAFLKIFYKIVLENIFIIYMSIIYVFLHIYLPKKSFNLTLPI